MRRLFVGRTVGWETPVRVVYGTIANPSRRVRVRDRYRRRDGARFRSRRYAASPGGRRRAGHALGAVLRPGLRLRCDTALPPAAGSPDRQRRVGDVDAVAGGVGGVDLHELVYQLVRSQ